MKDFPRGLSQRIMTLGGILLAAAALVACDDAPAPSPPFAIGLVSNNPNGIKNVQGFRERLASLAPVNGGKIIFVSPDRPVRGSELEKTLSDFVERRVNLIFTAGTPTGIAAHRITRNSGIPVVFGVIADPIGAGVMTNLSKPNGNMTGVMLGTNQARRLELFLQILPNIKTVAVLYNPNDPAPVSALAQLESAIGPLNITLKTYRCPDSAAVSAALAGISANVDALFLMPDSVVNKRISDIIEFSLKRKLPVSGPSMVQVNQGALMAYGFVHRDVGIQASQIAIQILKGLPPGDLPVQMAEAHLGFNLKTAARIGVAIPGHFLKSASILVR